MIYESDLIPAQEEFIDALEDWLEGDTGAAPEGELDRS